MQVARLAGPMKLGDVMLAWLSIRDIESNGSRLTCWAIDDFDDFASTQRCQDTAPSRSPSISDLNLDSNETPWDLLSDALPPLRQNAPRVNACLHPIPAVTPRKGPRPVPQRRAPPPRRAPPSRAQEKARCRCRKSKCLKLYCECFTAGRLRHEACQCTACRNSPEFSEERKKVISCPLSSQTRSHPALATGHGLY